MFDPEDERITFLRNIRNCLNNDTASHPTPRLGAHLLSAVSGCLFSMFAATLHIYRPCPVCSLSTQHAPCLGDSGQLNRLCYRSCITWHVLDDSQTEYLQDVTRLLSLYCLAVSFCILDHDLATNTAVTFLSWRYSRVTDVADVKDVTRRCLLPQNVVHTVTEPQQH